MMQPRIAALAAMALVSAAGARAVIASSWSEAPAGARCAELLDLPIAERAAEVLRARTTSMVAFCEPCGDLAPGAPVQVEPGQVAVVHLDGAYAVTVAGQPIDLGHRYVELEPGASYQSLAALAGCGAGAVAPVLRVLPVSSTGVLIYDAGHGAVAGPGAAAGAAPSVAQPEPAPWLAARRGAPWPAAWWLWLLGASATLVGVGALARWAAVGRVSHVPRAITLLPGARRAAAAPPPAGGTAAPALASRVGAAREEVEPIALPPTRRR